MNSQPKLKCQPYQIVLLYQWHRRLYNERKWKAATQDTHHHYIPRRPGLEEHTSHVISCYKRHKWTYICKEIICIWFTGSSAWLQQILSVKTPQYFAAWWAASVPRAQPFCDNAASKLQPGRFCCKYPFRGWVVQCISHHWSALAHFIGFGGFACKQICSPKPEGFQCVVFHRRSE